MIDPANITNYNLTNAELEEQLLFWVLAAGKNGTTAARCLDKFLEVLDSKGYGGPFNCIRVKCSYDNWPGDEIEGYKYLHDVMKDCGIGCYGIKARTLTELAFSKLDLKTCTTEDLESIYGIGPKTSRCFIMHTREGARVAGLDTHMLKHLRASGVEGVPKSTPATKKLYGRLEAEVLRLADEAGMTPADFDLMVWNKYKVVVKA